MALDKVNTRMLTGTEFDRWENTYTTVQSISADWYQTLLFNDITAELTISNGNTVSLSALSGGGGTLTNETDPIFSTWAQANSASYTSTYTTVNTNSASWAAGGSGSSGLSGISYNRWSFTGSPPISSFSLSGATSDTEEAYRVTIDFLLQDPLSYTVSNETITFTEAPPLSSNIVVIESYATASEPSNLTIVNDATTTITLDSSNCYPNYVRCTSSSAITLTLAAGQSTAIGRYWIIRQAAAGVATLSAYDSTPALITLNGDPSTAGQHTEIVAILVADGVVDIIGGTV